MTDIAQHTELTGQTVSTRPRALALKSCAKARDGRRPGARLPLALNPDGAYAVGLDLDRDHLTAVLVDLAGNVRHRIHTDLDAPSPTEALDLMCETVITLIKRQRLRRTQVSGLGVGIPGPMHQMDNGKGYIVNPKAFPGWHNIPLASWLRDRLRMPVFLENNATAAAVGEHWCRSTDRHLLLHLFWQRPRWRTRDGRRTTATGNAEKSTISPCSPRAERLSADDPPRRAALQHPLARTASPRNGRRTLEDLDTLLAAGHPFCCAGWTRPRSPHRLGSRRGVLARPEAICFGGRLSDRILSGSGRVARQLRHGASAAR